MSESRIPILYPFFARAIARLAVTVLFPTPPFPLIIIILCFILVTFSWTFFFWAIFSIIGLIFCSIIWSAEFFCWLFKLVHSLAMWLEVLFF